MHGVCRHTRPWNVVTNGDKRWSKKKNQNNYILILISKLWSAKDKTFKLKKDSNLDIWRNNMSNHWMWHDTMSHIIPCHMIPCHRYPVTHDNLLHDTLSHDTLSHDILLRDTLSHLFILLKIDKCNNFTNIYKAISKYGGHIQAPSTCGIELASIHSRM